MRALLSAADHATLARLLPLRPLMGGLLNHLAADPPGHAFATLAVLGRRLLGGGAAASALPPSLRAQPWGDAALLQLVEVAAASNAPADAAAAAAAAAADADAPAAAPPPAAAAALAAEAALEVLVMLCTDPENGMVPAAAAGSSAEGEVGLVVGQATKRVLRLLPKLRPFERLRHMRLLVEVAERCPGLAAEYGTSMPYDLTPKVGGPMYGIGVWAPRGAPLHIVNSVYAALIQWLGAINGHSHLCIQYCGLLSPCHAGTDLWPPTHSLRSTLTTQLEALAVLRSAATTAGTFTHVL